MTRLRIGIIHPDLGIGGPSFNQWRSYAKLFVTQAARNVSSSTPHWVCRKQGTKSRYSPPIMIPSTASRRHEMVRQVSRGRPSKLIQHLSLGTLLVTHFKSPFPRAIRGRFHILFANLRQLHLTLKLFLGVRSGDPATCDVYMVDQLSTCIPLIRRGIGRRVVFYCHFPDKLLADGKAAPSDGKRKGSLAKRIYRLPADWLEEYTTRKCSIQMRAMCCELTCTTGKSDVILANSQFTAGIFNAAFPSIHTTPRVVYPGINIDAYETHVATTEPEIGSLVEYVSSLPSRLAAQLMRFLSE